MIPPAFEHPGVVADDRRAPRPVRSASPSTSTSEPPIMKSVCVAGDVDARCEQLLGASAVGPVDGHRQAAAVGDVAGSRSRRTACRGRRAPSGGRATRRRRARSRRGTAPGRRSRAGCGSSSAPSPSAFTSTIRPLLEAHLEAVDARDHAGHDERVRRAHDPSVRRQSGVVKTSSVGMFGMCSMPLVVSNVAHIQRDAGSSPTTRSVPGPRNRMASKPALVERGGARASLAACSRHAATGSRRRAASRSRPPPRAARRPARRTPLGPALVRRRRRSPS